MGYRDPGAIAFVLEEFISDRESLVRMGQAARKEAESQTWAGFKNEFAEILIGVT